MGPQEQDMTALEATLQQKYIELLEKRISQLEAALNKRAKTEESDAEDSQAKESDSDDDNEANAKKKGSTGERYVNALRKWDKDSAAYKDETVAESAFKKEQPKDVAYIFRRVVYDSLSGEKRAHSEIDIKGPELVQVLKSEIDNKYPGVNFDGDGIYMQAPFPAIIHNWEKLKKVSERTPESQACKDLAHLLNRVAMSEELEDYFKTRDANITGNVTTFETMWTVFAPKTLIVVKPFMGIPQLLQVSQPPIPWYRAPTKNITWLYMSAWCWDFDGKKMVKVRYDLRIKRFRGTRAINELDFYPLSYHDKPEQLCDEIRERSHTYLRMTKFSKGGASQMLKYEGNAYVVRRKIVTATKGEEEEEDEPKDSRRNDDTFKARLVPIRSEIICDAGAYLQYANSYRSYPLGEMEHDFIEEAVIDVDDFFGNLKEDDIKDGLDKSTNDFLIIPGRLLGYSTKEKLWGQFNVDYTSPPDGKRPDKFHKQLQLNPTHKELIEALVSSHEKKAEEIQVRDIVDDKGKGLVLLLHGPPGVGKTLTAETIAQATGKPLFVVSVAEIGLDATRAEKNLEKLFNLATKWEAVLLVDEADVFLETRGATSDASRNALVSVLLRVLEYYQGIIILTTNRIKSIDVAVISRIHLAIRYTDLGMDQLRGIFKIFLDQLMPGDVKDRYKIDEFINTYGHHYSLNGRQIRNVVSAGLAAARHGAELGQGDGRLTYMHLKEVCEMTMEFQTQLKDHTMSQRLSNEAGHAYRSY